MTGPWSKRREALTTHSGAVVRTLVVIASIGFASQVGRWLAHYPEWQSSWRTLVGLCILFLLVSQSTGWRSLHRKIDVFLKRIETKIAADDERRTRTLTALVEQTADIARKLAAANKEETLAQQTVIQDRLDGIVKALNGKHEPSEQLAAIQETQDDTNAKVSEIRRQDIPALSSDMAIIINTIKPPTP